MNHTAQLLHAMAFYADIHGIHTGDQFAVPGALGPVLDICAIAYKQAEGPTPDVFFTDEVASIALIESSEPAMAAIRAISDALDSEPCETNGAPDYIEHVSNWAATPPVGHTTPPTVSEVIGRILRAARQANATTPTAA